MLKIVVVATMGEGLWIGVVVDGMVWGVGRLGKGLVRRAGVGWEVVLI